MAPVALAVVTTDRDEEEMPTDTLRAIASGTGIVDLDALRAYYARCPPRGRARRTFNTALRLALADAHNIVSNRRARYLRSLSGPRLIAMGGSVPAAAAPIIMQAA